MLKIKECYEKEVQAFGLFYGFGGGGLELPYKTFLPNTLCVERLSQPPINFTSIPINNIHTTIISSSSAKTMRIRLLFPDIWFVTHRRGQIIWRVVHRGDSRTPSRNRILVYQHILATIIGLRYDLLCRSPRLFF